MLSKPTMFTHGICSCVDLYDGSNGRYHAISSIVCLSLYPIIMSDSISPSTINNQNRERGGDKIDDDTSLPMLDG